MKGFVEHPELTPEALAAVKAAFLANGFEGMEPSFADRRFLAAFLRAAIAAMPDLYAWAELAEIADNLHSLPPPPPTLAEAREAARQLAGPSAAVVHAYLDTLQEVEQ